MILEFLLLAGGIKLGWVAAAAAAFVVFGIVQGMNNTDTLLIAPIAKTSATTTTANFDCAGADWASIRLFFKAELNTNAVGPTLSLSESDDTVVTNFATIVADRTDEDLASAREVRYEVDLRKRKRYLRLSVTARTATNDDITFCAVGTLSRKERSPSSTTGLADAVIVVN
jgi:hypothetical protein